MRLASTVAAKSKLRLLHALGKQEVTLSVGESRLKLRVNTRDVLSEWLACDRYFEPAVREAFLSRLKPGMTVLDIGANVGYYTALAAERVGSAGTVISMEPQPEVCRRLRGNVHRNGFKNVCVIQAAAGAENDRVAFHVPAPGWESHGSRKLNGSFDLARTIEVDQRRVDDVLMEIGVTAVDVIKIDVEGGEWDALRGMTRLLHSSPHPTLIFEAYEGFTRMFGHCVFDLLQWLNVQGYSTSQLEEFNWIAERD